MFWLWLFAVAAFETYACIKWDQMRGLQGLSDKRLKV